MAPWMHSDRQNDLARRFAEEAGQGAKRGPLNPAVDGVGDANAEEAGSGPLNPAVDGAVDATAEEAAWGPLNPAVDDAVDATAEEAGQGAGRAPRGPPHNILRSPLALPRILIVIA